ncbi:hypothetical protein PIB30_021501 [Stylosanthes scabra]|uniref:Uncharacterized protein n=1 Tax=Stylosanthes scabra TaxID=79078 RepID=A0ABU6Z6H8_9FABA|nr:hypothetical protein [Stylosanthes scabra]
MSLHYSFVCSDKKDIIFHQVHVFNKFKNPKGGFDNETIVQDIQGMWSFYEAAQLRVHGEDILEEAHEFAYNKLKSITNQLSPSLADQINQSLLQPLHKAIPRMMARSYMSFYEEDRQSSSKLFAKLDFNMLQKQHEKEIAIAIKWWEKSEFARKFSYARQRMVELYFWPFSMNSEPKYSSFRRMMAKLMQWMSVIDDTFDAYGTIEELELFTQAIQRWDITCIASLPECYKDIFNTIIELFDEIVELLNAMGEESNLVLQYFKQLLITFVEDYMVEAKWCHEGYIPAYDEYKYRAFETSSATHQALTIIFIVLGGFATKEMLHWISNNNNIPLIIQASTVVARLTNDLASRKFEQQRKHAASAVECCMKQYGFSEKEAYEFIKKDINHYWKDNKEYLELIEYIPRQVLDCILNLARISFALPFSLDDRAKDWYHTLLAEVTSDWSTIFSCILWHIWRHKLRHWLVLIIIMLYVPPKRNLRDPQVVNNKAQRELDLSAEVRERAQIKEEEA